MNPHGRRGHVLSIDDLLTTRLRARSTWLTVVKASAAATIAWVIADHLTTTTIPVLAPVLALGTVRSSLYSTLAQGLQSVVGNLIGVALALLMVDLWGISNVIVFAAAFVSLALARFLPLNSGARDQVPFIVMFVVLLDTPGSGYGAARLLDCVIGSAVGIAVALLVPERPAVAGAERAIADWTAAIVRALGEIAEAVEQHTTRLLGSDEQHEFMSFALADLHPHEAVAVDAVIAADQSVRFNPRATNRRAEVRELADALAWHRRISPQVEAIALGVDELYDRAGPPLRLRRETMGRLLRWVSELPALPLAGRQLQSDRIAELVERELSEVVGDTSVARVLESVSLLGRIDQLRGELLGEVLDAPEAPTTT